MIKDQNKDFKKKRNLIIFTTLSIFLIVFTAFQHYFLVGSPESASQKYIFRFIVNLNILCLMVVLVLLLRNLIKLYFERRRKIFGSRLKTKLVILFVSFSIIPTVLLFFYASGTIKRAFQSWIQPQMDVTQNIVDFVQAIDDDYIKKAAHFSKRIEIELENGKWDDPNLIIKLFQTKIQEYSLNSLSLYSGEKLIASAKKDGINKISSFEIPKNVLEKLYSGEEPFYGDVKYGDDNFVQYAIPVYNRNYHLVLNYPLSKKIGENKILLRKKIEGYKQMKLAEKINVTGYTLLIGIFSLLIIFSATWLGMYIAKSISIPMSKIAEGFNAVSSGDLSVTVDSRLSDEFSILSDSFNSMTLELRNSNEEIKRVQENLRKTNTELEARRMYMATVLQNITAGVLSIDDNGIITTFNKSLSKMLNMNDPVPEGIFYGECFTHDKYKGIVSIIETAYSSRYPNLKKEITLNLSGEIKTILISTAKMRDRDNNNMGTVFVFDELTQIIKAKRINVWREIAERIAHEIKNPLTPIQLSVQRLIRKFEKSGNIPDDVFMECINNINREVNSLKELVNTFSNFARVPEKNPKPTDVNELLKEVVSLYNVNVEETEIYLKPAKDVPDLFIDSDLMKQVFKNLINNSIESVEGYKPQIEISTYYDQDSKTVKINFADNGPGIVEEIKDKLFVPYFSTKTEGSGLGLSIVHRIIEDHEGFIRVSDNNPNGAVFSLILPCSINEQHSSPKKN